MAQAKVQKTVNVWVAGVSLNNRKSCPTCHSKLNNGNSIASVGEYIHTKFSHAFYACEQCFDTEIGRRIDKKMVNICFRSGHSDSIAWLKAGAL